MAPTKDIIITIPTLEGIVAALMLFHSAVIDSLLDYNILLGCALILLSFNTKHVSKVSNLQVLPTYIPGIQDCNDCWTCIVQDCYKTTDPDEQDEDAAPRYQSYGTIQGPRASDRVESDGIKVKELGSIWRVISWVLFIGGIFIIIPAD